jgi:hypothetical protein
MIIVIAMIEKPKISKNADPVELADRIKGNMTTRVFGRYTRLKKSIQKTLV